MIVTLSRKELSDCKQAATLRWQLARLSGVTNQRKDKGRTDQDLDFLGIKAELAVSKVFDLDFNPFQLGVDDGADMFLHNISIDVKSTFYPHGKLLFKSKKSFKSNCSVLVAKVDELTFHILDELGKPIVNDDLTPMKFRSLRELDFITDYLELDDLEIIQ